MQHYFNVYTSQITPISQIYVPHIHEHVLLYKQRQYNFVYVRTYEPFQDINLCTELLCCQFSCYCHWRMMHPHVQSMCAANLAFQIVVLSPIPVPLSLLNIAGLPTYIAWPV